MAEVIDLGDRDSNEDAAQEAPADATVTAADETATEAQTTALVEIKKEIQGKAAREARVAQRTVPPAGGVHPPSPSPRACIVPAWHGPE